MSSRASICPHLLFVLLTIAAGCHRSDPATDAPKQQTIAKAPVDAAAARVLRVPRATGAIHLDGELDEDDWRTAARTGPFVDAQGVEARPFSEAHFLWDDQNLYLALYAADDDIRAAVQTHDGPVWIDDSFSLHLAAASGPTFSFDISAMGVTTDALRDPHGKTDASWESGITVSVDRDGTVNDARDEDEEWVVEAVIPWRSMNLAATPGTRLTIDLGRCDTPRAAGSKRRCSGWGAGQAQAKQSAYQLELSAGQATVRSVSHRASP